MNSSKGDSGGVKRKRPLGGATSSRTIHTPYGGPLSNHPAQ